jgi:amino acid transporter
MESGLRRAVGRWSYVAMMVNGIIGAGIFGLPSKVHALVGVYGLLAYGLCALLMVCITLVFAEVGSRFSLTGGPYLYARLAFGPLAGFLLGWLMWITRVTALAVITNVMVSYISFFWAPAATGLPRAIVATVVLIGVTVLNLVGVRRVAGAVNAITLLKLVPLVVFVAVGVFALDRHAFVVPPSVSAGAFGQAMFQLVFAFAGFEAAAVLAGEIHEPQRNLPFALMVAIALTTVIYVLIQVVCIGTLPELAASEKPLADAGARFLGPAGGALLAVGAQVSALGTLCGSMLIGSRVLFAMSEQDQLPKLFERLHPRFRTPTIAILLTAVLAIALTVTGTFTYVVGLNVLTRLATFVLTAGAMMAFRRRAGAPPAAFQVPGGTVLAVITIVTCVWLGSRSQGTELRDVAIAVVAGLVLFAAHRWGVRQRPPAPTPGAMQ